MRSISFVRVSSRGAESAGREGWVMLMLSSLTKLSSSWRRCGVRSIADRRGWRRGRWLISACLAPRSGFMRFPLS